MLINVTEEQLNEVLDALQSAVELSQEDDRRIANAPEGDGYTDEDVETAKAYTANLQATVEMMSQRAHDAQELTTQIGEALGDAYAYRQGEGDLSEPDTLDEVDIQCMRKYQALADQLGIVID